MSHDILRLSGPFCSKIFPCRIICSKPFVSHDVIKRYSGLRAIIIVLFQVLFYCPKFIARKYKYNFKCNVIKSLALSRFNIYNHQQALNGIESYKLNYKAFVLLIFFEKILHIKREGWASNNLLYWLLQHIFLCINFFNKQ